MFCVHEMTEEEEEEESIPFRDIADCMHCTTALLPQTDSSVNIAVLRCVGFLSTLGFCEVIEIEFQSTSCSLRRGCEDSVAQGTVQGFFLNNSWQTLIPRKCPAAE